MGNSCKPSITRKPPPSTLKQSHISLSSPSQKTIPLPSPVPQAYSICNNPQKKCLTFKHAPLTNSDYLSNKFYHDSARPDQVNLEWQITGVEFCGGKKGEDGEIRVGVINRVRVKLWVVVGGKEKKNLTGLVLEIQEYGSVEEIVLEQGTKTQEIKYHNIKIPQLAPTDKLRLILQSISDPTQSLSLLNTYTHPPFSLPIPFSHPHPQPLKLLTQVLLWNSLAFQLQNIYNQNEEIFNEQQHSQQLKKDRLTCVICQEEDLACILLPCRHMCIGRRCMAGFRRVYKLCPLCKRDYDEIIVYRELANG